jgi:hypothetical protein
MSGYGWMTTLALALMLSTATLAGGLIWVTAADPVTVAAAAARGDVPTLLMLIAARIVELVW